MLAITPFISAEKADHERVSGRVRLFLFTFVGTFGSQVTDDFVECMAAEILTFGRTPDLFGGQERWPW